MPVASARVSFAIGNQPVLKPLGFEPLPVAEVAIDGRTFHTLCLDFGPNSVDGWLAWLVGSQLGVEEHDGELLDPANRQAILGNRRIRPTRWLNYGGAGWRAEEQAA